MATTKQDLRQIEAKTQDFEQLALESGTGLNQIIENIDTDLDFPLKISATFPTADSKLRISNSKMSAPDGVNKITPPVRKQIFPELDSLWIDFQTQSVSSALDFDITWPTTNTVGQFRYMCLTLISSGKIKALFTNEAASEAALVNPGGFFVSGGLPVGYLAIQCTSALGYFKTAGSISNVIESAKIFRFGSGSGGGSGTGDANSFTENLKHRLTNSFYEFVTPVIFEIDEKTLTTEASSTADFDIVDGTYKFEAAGEIFTSINMFCEEFLESDDDSRRVELHTEWFDENSTDSNAIYQVSLNGTNYETITMTQQGLSNKFTGDRQLAIPASSSLFSASSVSTLKLDNASSQSIATRFTTTNKCAINQLQLTLNKTGSPAGSYVISIVEDNAGSPTGSVLHSQIKLASSLSAGANSLTINSFRKILLPGSNYWVIVSTDAAYKASYNVTTTFISVNSSTGGTNRSYNGTLWSTSASGIAYTLSGHIYDLRVKVTSSAGSVLDPNKLKAFGIFYNETVGSVVTGYQALQKLNVDGNADVTQFTITSFLPNADFLKVYDIRTGQVYRYPAFSLSGNVVEFPSGTFLAPGVTVELLFDQSEGTGYDYSDTNANLLASNHLGSTDATIDKSVSGRGIFLRRPDGTLREICIDNSDNIVIYSV
jgi:hypothetical protein